MTTQYIAKQPINHNGTSYAVGDAVDATAADAKFLLLAGYVKEEQQQQSPPPSEPPAPPNNGEGANNNNGVGDASQPPTKPKYGTWVKAALNAELDAREIEHDAAATNAVLAELLVADDLSREGWEMKAGNK